MRDIEQVQKYRDQVISNLPKEIPKPAKAIERQAYRLLMADQNITEQRRAYLREIMRYDYSLKFYCY